MPADQPALPVRRRGVVLVDEDQLARLLRLPDQWRVLGFQPFYVRMAIGVLVEGPDLPECAPGSEPPRVDTPPPAALSVQRVAEVIRAAATGCDRRLDRLDQPSRACPACAAEAVVALYGEPAPAAGPRVPVSPDTEEDAA